MLFTGNVALQWETVLVELNNWISSIKLIYEAFRPSILLIYEAFRPVLLTGSTDLLKRSDSRLEGTILFANWTSLLLSWTLVNTQKRARSDLKKKKIIWSHTKQLFDFRLYRNIMRDSCGSFFCDAFLLFFVMWVLDSSGPVKLHERKQVYSLESLLLYSMEERKWYRFGTTWEWGNIYQVFKLNYPSTTAFQYDSVLLKTSHNNQTSILSALYLWTLYP